MTAVLVDNRLRLVPYGLVDVFSLITKLYFPRFKFLVSCYLILIIKERFILLLILLNILTTPNNYNFKAIDGIFLQCLQIAKRIKILHLLI